MTTIKSFINRLKRIGIEVELVSNIPWIYMKKVNDKPVKGIFEADHGFTVFFTSVKDGRESITDIPTIFNKIRETLKQ
jgi:hypothetical protein